MKQEVDAVVQHYQQIKKADGRLWHPRIQATPTERKRIAEMLKIYSVEDCCAAIDGIHVTPHNIGENSTGKKYLRLGLIFDPEKFNGYFETGLEWREEQQALADLRQADWVARQKAEQEEAAARAEPRESLKEAFKQTWQDG